MFVLLGFTLSNPLGGTNSSFDVGNQSLGTRYDSSPAATHLYPLPRVILSSTSLTEQHKSIHSLYPSTMSPARSRQAAARHGAATIRDEPIESYNPIYNPTYSRPVLVRQYVLVTNLVTFVDGSDISVL